jgi:nicotinamidase-related amidase
MGLIDRGSAIVVAIDLQERLLAEIPDREAVVSQAVLVLRTARELGVPVIATEQYPKGLGRTVERVAAVFESAPVEKVAFGCMGEPVFEAALSDLERNHLVLVGAETHVCVLQTALSALERGYRVFVVSDAVGSRAPAQHRAGLERMAAAGVSVATAEMVVFELLGCAGTPEFKRVLPLIKEASERSAAGA